VFAEQDELSNLPLPEKAFEWPVQAATEKNWQEAARRWAVLRRAYSDLSRPWVEGAIAHMEAGEEAQAGVLLSFARDRFPENADVLVQSAGLAMLRGDLDLAGEFLLKARQRFPDSLQVWIKSAVHAEQRGELQEALAFNERSRQAWPDRPGPFVQFAELAMRAGKWEQALARWEEVRSRFPELPTGYLRAAEAAKQLDRRQEARKLVLALQYGSKSIGNSDGESSVPSGSIGRAGARRIIELIWTKAVFNLRSEVHRNYLSYSWWILEPLLHMVVYYLVFGLLLQRGGENFPVFLLTGLVPWMWFSKAVSNSSGSIIGGQQLMLKVGVPPMVFPLVSILQTTLKQLPVFALLVAFLFSQGIGIGVQWFALLPVILVQVFLMVAFAGAIAALIPFARDLSYLVPTGLTFLMFLSGIFYDYRTVSQEWQSVFLLNPMAFLLKCYREIFIEGIAPDFLQLAWWFFGCTAACALLLLAFRRLRYVYPRIVLE
jgi:lipopolysaccharide transport system permease protein